MGAAHTVTCVCLTVPRYSPASFWKASGSVGCAVTTAAAGQSSASNNAPRRWPVFLGMRIRGPQAVGTGCERDLLQVQVTCDYLRHYARTTPSLDTRFGKEAGRLQLAADRRHATASPSALSMLQSAEDSCRWLASPSERRTSLSIQPGSSSIFSHRSGLLGQLESDALALGHADESSGGAFRHCALAPCVEKEGVGTDSETEEVVVGSVEPYVVELERASLVFRPCLDLEELAADLEIGRRDARTDAFGEDAEALQVTPDEVLADVAPVRVRYAAEGLKACAGPDRLRRVLTDDEQHELNRIHSGAVHRAPGRSRFQKTRK